MCRAACLLPLKAQGPSVQDLNLGVHQVMGASGVPRRRVRAQRHGRCCGNGDAPGLWCDCMLCHTVRLHANRACPQGFPAWHACMQARVLSHGACCPNCTHDVLTCIHVQRSDVSYANTSILRLNILKLLCMCGQARPSVTRGTVRRRMRRRRCARSACYSATWWPAWHPPLILREVRSSAGPWARSSASACAQRPPRSRPLRSWPRAWRAWSACGALARYWLVGCYVVR